MLESKLFSVADGAGLAAAPNIYQSDAAEASTTG